MKRQTISFAVVLFSLWLDILGISLVMPILPLYAEMYGASSTMIGILVSSYSCATAISTLYAGRISDRYGRKIMILASLFGGAFGSLAQGFAWNMPSLLCFRAATGFFGMSPPVVFSFIQDISTMEDRPQKTALAGGSMTLSFLCGPILGGLFASLFGYRAPLFAASCFGFIAFFLALFLVEETNPVVLERRLREATLNPVAAVEVEEEEAEEEKAEEEEIAEKEEEEEEEEPAAIPPEPVKHCLDLSVRTQLLITCSIGLALRYCFASFSTIMSLYMTDQFSTPVSLIGLVYASGAAFAFPMQVFVFPWLCSKMSVVKVVMFGCTLVVFANFLFASADAAYLMGVGNIICYCGSTCVTSGFPVLLSGFSGRGNRGTVMSYGETANSLGSVAGPILLGALYSVFPELPWLSVSAAIFVLGCGSCLVLLLSGWPPVVEEKTEEKELELVLVEKSQEESAATDELKVE